MTGRWTYCQAVPIGDGGRRGAPAYTVSRDGRAVGTIAGGRVGEFSVANLRHGLLRRLGDRDVAFSALGIDLALEARWPRGGIGGELKVGDSSYALVRASTDKLDLVDARGRYVGCLLARPVHGRDGQSEGGQSQRWQLEGWSPPRWPDAAVVFVLACLAGGIVADLKSRSESAALLLGAG